MKKRIITIASLVHLVLWAIFMLVSFVSRFTYSASDKEPLDAALSQGVYNVFIIVAIVGTINATVLFFSLRAVSLCSNGEYKGMRIVALCFSMIATILFYSAFALLFISASDTFFVFPVVWLFFELCCGVLLIISKRR